MGVFKTRNDEMAKWQYISVFQKGKIYVANGACLKHETAKWQYMKTCDF